MVKEMLAAYCTIVGPRDRARHGRDLLEQNDMYQQPRFVRILVDSANTMLAVVYPASSGASGSQALMVFADRRPDKIDELDSSSHRFIDLCQPSPTGLSSSLATLKPTLQRRC